MGTDLEGDDGDINDPDVSCAMYLMEMLSGLEASYTYIRELTLRSVPTTPSSSRGSIEHVPTVSMKHTGKDNAQRLGHYAYDR